MNKKDMENNMLSLYIPKEEDLWFRALMLNDADTMSYNHAYGGTIDFKKECWHDWYDYWVLNCGDKRFYRYLKNEDDTFVGEIAYHLDDEINNYVANVIILAKYRGRGYGSSGLDMLCESAFENGISVLYDDIAIDNEAIYMFKKHGFIEEYRTNEKIYLKKYLNKDTK